MSDHEHHQHHAAQGHGESLNRTALMATVH